MVEHTLVIISFKFTLKTKMDFMLNLVFQLSNQLAQEIHEDHMVRGPQWTSWVGWLELLEKQYVLTWGLILKVDL